MQSIENVPDGQSREIHAAITAAGSAASSPEFVSVKTTAARLDVSRLTIYRRFHEGLFPGRKFGRSIKILASFVADLDAEIKSGRPVDVEMFAADWLARAQERVALAVEPIQQVVSPRPTRTSIDATTSKGAA